MRRFAALPWGRNWALQLRRPAEDPGGLVVRLSDWLTPVARTGRLALVCRPPSPVAPGPFEAVSKHNEGWMTGSPMAGPCLSESRTIRTASTRISATPWLERPSATRASTSRSPSVSSSRPGRCRGSRYAAADSFPLGYQSGPPVVARGTRRLLRSSTARSSARILAARGDLPDRIGSRGVVMR
jgi:hypothetical protein